MVLNNLIGPVTGLLDKFIEDKDQKAALAHEIATMGAKHAQELAISQIEVNKAEAASGSFFKGGWRPFVGWVCGVAFCYHFIIQPVIIFIVALTGIIIPDLPINAPILSFGILIIFSKLILLYLVCFL